MLTAFCSAKVIELREDVNGTLLDTIIVKTDTLGGYKVGMVKERITIPPRNEVWDGVVGYFYIPDFLEVTDTAAGEGDIDSAMIRVLTGSGYLERTIYDDTCETLPCTLSFSWLAEHYRSILKGGATNIMSVADSLGGGVWEPAVDSSWDALFLDHLWFEYRGVDTVGSSGADLIFEVQYWFRFWKED
jgi:hypothetical protein